MLNGFGNTLRLGLAQHGAALVSASRWRSGRIDVLAEQNFRANEAGSLAEGLARLFSDARVTGSAMSVVLSDELARLWLVTPPPQAARRADLQGAAALRFQSLYGVNAQEWAITADWDAQHPFLAAASPLALLAGLQQAAQLRRADLVEVAPQFVTALNRWRRQRRRGVWFGVVHGDVLTVAAVERERIAAVRTVSVPPDADREWLDGALAREALRVGLPRPDRLQVCGNAPVGWSSDHGSLKFVCAQLGESQSGLSPLAQLAATGSGA